ncbi:hypothetical protein FJY68_06975 [candidate division WOR-3 bacterium]|uniref:VCBS repeat-containing protein n=1 Tax=candidate division WOR-3 bacterium TaxID=2052148 RepID=A0A937XH83_UNCW3|nr:hypothetical protein [candidate division WOR-3 bacterium]
MNVRLSVLLALLAVVAFAQTPVFEAPVALEANGGPINVGTGGNASPFLVDWNGDGRQDLLLGQYSAGKVRFYANIGEDTAPVFGDFEYLQADGADISVSSG